MSDASTLTLQADSHRAIRNAIKLGASLLCTWGVAMAVRVVLPRFLGPATFGDLNFAEAFAATFFITLDLGVDTYTRREVAVRPAHAREFFGPIFLLRTFIAVPLIASMLVVLRVTGRSEEVQLVAVLLGLNQFFVITNGTLSALLHAHGSVSEMSVLSVASKIMWGAIVFAGMLTHSGIWIYALAVLVPEVLEVIALYFVARRHLGLAFLVDLRGGWTVAVASFPYFLGTAAQAAYSRIGVGVLEYTSEAREVGYYSAASGLAGIALLMSPMVLWVLHPMIARASARSREEADVAIRRSLEFVLVVATPVVLIIALGSDFWTRLILGPAFAPASLALSLTAGALLATYVAMVGGTVFNALGDGWTPTLIVVIGLFVNGGLNLALVKPMASLLERPGSGGAACALSFLLSEAFAAIVQISLLGRRAFDRRSIVTVVKTALVSGAVVGLDMVLRPLGPARLILDGLAYAVLAVATGALPLREISTLVVAAIRTRRGKRAPA